MSCSCCAPAWRRIVQALLLGAGLLAGAASARTVEIVSADRLELRKVDGQDLVILSGELVELHIDKDVVKAKRIEFNRSRRVLNIVGRGSYLSHPVGPDGSETEQLLSGQDLVINLNNTNVLGEDVIVSSANLEIRGDQVERVPGQLSASSGYFTPCAKCGRTPNDYAFRARDIRLYPGDRLVAYGATLLLAGAPVAYLPLIVLFLNDKDRQPRVNFGLGADDGTLAAITLSADLPFVFGQNALGYTYLRYYSQRSAKIGFGVDLTAYDPFPTLRRLNLRSLLTPQPPGKFGYDIDFGLEARGNVALAGTEAGLNYQLKVNRQDTNGTYSKTDAEKGYTDLNLTADAKIGTFSVSAEYLDRYGPPPVGRIGGVYKRPEIVLDPAVFTAGPISADFRVTLGGYFAASNPLSRRANSLGDNILVSRLLENHTITYQNQLWPGASLTLSNTFTGAYYSTGQRVVNLTLGGSLNQNFSLFGLSGSSASLNYNYLRLEGVSPFAFDTSYTRTQISALLGGRLTLVPVAGVTLNADQGIDLALPREQIGASNFGLSIARDPVNLSLNYRPNFYTGLAESGSLNFTLGSSSVGLLASVGASYDKANGFGPVTFGLSYAESRLDSTRLTAVYNPRSGAWDNVGATLSAVGSEDAVLNPVALTATETLYFGLAAVPGQVSERPPYARGEVSLTWNDLTFGVTHDTPLAQLSSFTGAPGSERLGSLNFEVRNQAGSATSWSLRYGSPNSFGLNYSTVRGGWTTPQLIGRYSTTRGSQRLGADLTVNLPGLDQPQLELAGANLSANYDLTPRLNLNGTASYSRSRVRGLNGGPDQVTDTLSLRPLNLTFGLGNNPKPDVYVSTILQQDFSWLNGMALQPQPLKPILKLTVDRCCWALQFEINPVEGYARFGLLLPGGDVNPGIRFGPAGPDFSGLRIGN